MSLYTFSLVFLLVSLEQQPKPVRQLLIFGSEATRDLVAEQQRLLAIDSVGMRERDLVVKEIWYSASTKSLFSHYKIHAKSFAIVLVGKDGGEKYIEQKPQSARTIFALIDGMPMRQHEMKQRKKN